MTAPSRVDDPAERSASSWSARRAAYKSRGVPNDDPRIRACDAALSYWRVRRAIDTEVQAGHLAQTFGDAIAEQLRDHAVSA